MAAMRAQAERFGAEFVRGNVTPSICRRAPFHDHDRRRRRSHARTVIIATGASAQAARAAVRARADGPRRLDLRDLRRLLLPRQADRRRRRRRLGARGSDVPHALRVARHGRPPARHAARVEDHAGQGVRATRRSRSSGTPRSSTCTTSRSGRGDAACTLRNLKTGAEKDLPVDGVFVAIGHTPNTSLFKGQLEMDATGYLVTRDGAKTNVPASSPAATCRITSTARRSPRPAQAAWRRSTPSGTWSITDTDGQLEVDTSDSNF